MAVRSESPARPPTDTPQHIGLRLRRWTLRQSTKIQTPLASGKIRRQNRGNSGFNAGKGFPSFPLWSGDHNPPLQRSPDPAFSNHG